MCKTSAHCGLHTYYKVKYIYYTKHTHTHTYTSPCKHDQINLSMAVPTCEEK